MAWIHNGRKYWYHNGKRYSKNIRRKKRYYYVAGGKSKSTDYQGYLETKASGMRVHTSNDNYYFDTIDTSKIEYNDDFWNF